MRIVRRYDPHATDYGRNIGFRFRFGNAGVQSVFFAMKLV